MRRFDTIWLLLWGLLSSAGCVSAARELSATFDEPFYLRAGVQSWRDGSNRELMKAGTMPLPVDIECLPVYIAERLRGEPFDIDRDLHTLLPFARGMNLAFWWLLLVYATLLARRFGGPAAGRFAVVLIATEPSLLGHACLATTDIALAAMVLVFAYHFDRGRAGGPFQRWVLPGLLYGLAMSAKASALMFVPIIVVAFEAPYWNLTGGARGLWQSMRECRADGWKIFLVGILFVFAYCGSDWKPHPRWERTAAAMPDDGTWTPAARWLTERAAVFPNAGEAFHYQFKHNVRGHGSYVLGEWHPRAVWYYFPVALSIKLTTVVLFVLGGLLVARPRMLCTSLGLAALLLFLFSLNCRVQIGVRLVFPVIVFLLLAIALGVARLVSGDCGWGGRARTAPALAPPPRSGEGGKKQDTRSVSSPLPASGRGAGGERFALSLLSILCLIPPLTAWPDGLRYGNRLWGGSDATCLYLSDSNADWGQGMSDLDRWTEAHGLPVAMVWYYGRDPAIASDPNRCLPLHMESLYDLRSSGDVWQHVRGKVVAVSTTLLYGNPAISETMPHAVAFFHGQKPVGRTRNFLVYDFRP